MKDCSRRNDRDQMIPDFLPKIPRIHELLRLEDSIDQKEGTDTYCGKWAGVPDRAEKQQINKVRTISFLKKNS